MNRDCWGNPGFLTSHSSVSHTTIEKPQEHSMAQGFSNLSHLFTIVTIFVLCK